jgi:hypothetical protein
VTAPSQGECRGVVFSRVLFLRLVGTLVLTAVRNNKCEWICYFVEALSSAVPDRRPFVNVSRLTPQGGFFTSNVVRRGVMFGIGKYPVGRSFVEERGILWIALFRNRIRSTQV